MANDNALALATDFNLMSMFDGMDPELLRELRDEAEDLDNDISMNYRQIKPPAAGQNAYVLMGEDGDDDTYAKEFDAVIVFTHRMNAYWPPVQRDGNAARVPECSSIDGKTGLSMETGEVISCDTCPYNQYGSGIDKETGQPGRGKACKNMRRLYLMMHNNPDLHVLSVPPTSTRDVNKALVRLASKGHSYTSFVAHFSLEKATNPKGQAYCKVVLTKGKTLPRETIAKVIALREEIKQQFKGVAITADDYNVQPAVAQAAAQAAAQPAVQPAARPAAQVREDPQPYEEAVAVEDLGDEELPFA